MSLCDNRKLQLNECPCCSERTDKFTYWTSAVPLFFLSLFFKAQKALSLHYFQSSQCSLQHPPISFWLTSITAAAPSWTGLPGLSLCCNLGHCRLCFSSNAPLHTHTTWPSHTNGLSPTFSSLHSEGVRSGNGRETRELNLCNMPSKTGGKTGCTNGFLNDGLRADLWDYSGEKEGVWVCLCVCSCLRGQVTY